MKRTGRTHPILVRAAERCGCGVTDGLCALATATGVARRTMINVVRACGRGRNAQRRTRVSVARTSQAQSSGVRVQRDIQTVTLTAPHFVASLPVQIRIIARTFVLPYPASLSPLAPIWATHLTRPPCVHPAVAYRRLRTARILVRQQAAVTSSMFPALVRRAPARIGLPLARRAAHPAPHRSPPFAMHLADRAVCSPVRPSPGRPPTGAVPGCLPDGPRVHES